MMMKKIKFINKIVNHKYKNDIAQFIKLDNIQIQKSNYKINL